MRFETFLRRHGRPRSLEQGAHLFRQGDTVPPCYLLRVGLLKAYYLTRDGKEFIKSFFCEGAILGSLRAGEEDIPCPFSVVALEPCQLVGVPLALLRESLRNDLELANEVIDALIELALRKERREHDFLVLSPEDNYRRLRADSPELLQRLTQNDIARYLGITPVALSRIRARMHRSGKSGGE